MKYLSILLVCLSLGLASTDVNAEGRAYPKTDEEFQKMVDALEWSIEPKTYEIVHSNAKFQLPEGFGMLFGHQAETYLFLNNGTEFSNIDALVLKGETSEELIFSFQETGYIKDDDWNDLDADLLLEGIIESTEESNAERIKNNISPLEVVGWVQEPVYDESANMVSWAIKARDADGDEVINAIALKLGRKGFNRITWVGAPNEYIPNGGLLEEASVRFKYDEGFKYTDFASTDKVAAFGLASLVAVSAGSKSGKGVALGLLATILAFGKKLWFIILIPFVALRKFFSRKAKTVQHKEPEE
ncbi:DUF2167 domain-containing protein [Terasakiella pusilla]|uniref:DUF2167 domain-containing protein n=1 Tax=Terasakiella pusilla TaxID=64973 RepID=UPI003AA7EF12